jgi:hypothetical protein
MGFTSERTVTQAAQQQDASEYCLFWRSRPGHPWRSLRFASRASAYRRYFFLIERGIEAYLERRRPRAV